MDITVSNPDEEFAPPSYEGPAERAHTYLAPGEYRTDEGRQLVVTINGSSYLT